MSPKKKDDHRPVFPGDLAEELLRVARERSRPESDLSPLLQALAREWLQEGSYRRREEEIKVITDRLVAVEDQLRALTQGLLAVPSPAAIKQTGKVVPTLDNLTRRVRVTTWTNGSRPARHWMLASERFVSLGVTLNNFSVSSLQANLSHSQRIPNHRH